MNRAKGKKLVFAGHIGGGHKPKHVLPITIDGCELELLVWERDKGLELDFGLFVPGQKYSRKDIKVSMEGVITEDLGRKNPASDLTDHEPVFTSSNEQIVQMVRATLAKTGRTTVN